MIGAECFIEVYKITNQEEIYHSDTIDIKKKDYYLKKNRYTPITTIAVWYIKRKPNKIGTRNSLSENIKTKEQGDAFMQQINTL